VDVTQESFDRDVLERSHARPVVVDFWADWCGPCKALAPVLERAVAEHEDVELAKVDVDANPELAARYEIRGIPAVKAFRRGQVVAEFVGAQSPTAVGAFLDGVAGPSAAERLVEELRASGEHADVLEALEAGDVERALELLLAAVEASPSDEKDRLRRLIVELFGDLGHEHPATVRFRRRLATALY
jgi:putative thioredoxin